MTFKFNPMHPLAEKAEQLNTVAQPYQHVYDQIADQITFTDLSPCPLCHDDQLVEYIQPHNTPEHGEYSVAISCRQCRIQTQPQYWFISEPSSAVKALETTIKLWQLLTHPTVMPSKAEASQASAENDPVIASAARQPEPDPVIPAQAGIQKSGVLISFQEYADWQRSKQDAARWQYIKNHLYLVTSRSRFIGSQQVIGDLSLKLSNTPTNRVGELYAQNLERHIAASIKQQAAKS